jgi:hypothetical protein
MLDPLLRDPIPASARRLLESDELGIDGQLQDLGSPLFPTGRVGRGDQIPQSQIFSFDPARKVFLFGECFHFEWYRELGVGARE